ncbi:MAG: Holliday junction branch migration protein RuvA [Acholeplasmataceae bacterium]|jgi:Holliday junction DNA helicase RuvA
MYATIQGFVTWIEPSYIVLENQGIGYLILTPNPYSFSLNTESKVFVHHYVKEDIDALYGFQSLEAKKMFIKLINVSGIGPKSALSILANDRLDELVRAIEMADIAYLKRFPGIGPKSAQQIILDLQGKIQLSPTENHPKLTDVEEALVALGYKKADIKKTIATLDGNLTIEDMIKEALKKMTRSHE